MRGRVAAAIGLAATVALGVTCYGIAAEDPAPASAGRPGSTAQLERRDLVDRTEFDGPLGYSDERELSAGRPGTVTWLPDEGATVGRGRPIYAVDGAASHLLFGQIPQWRPFASGMSDGDDVRQLERNLAAMGYDAGGDLTVDREFDSDTSVAIADWQEHLGVEETGRLELGDVVFARGRIRVGSHSASIGSSAAGPLMTISSTDRVVTLDVEPADRDAFERGKEVEVELPDGTAVEGIVRHVGRVAEAPPPEEQADADPTIEVIVRLTGDSGTSGYDEAPVQVLAETARAEDVVAAPIASLLALAEGGYALEVVEGAGTSLVPVELGAFADGFVEVRGEVDEDAVVVVPG